MEMRKIEWKRILLAKEYFYTSLFIFQSEQLVVNIAEKSKLKHFWIWNFFFVQTSIWGMEGGQRLLRNPSQSRTQKEQKCWFIIRLKIFRISYFQKYFYKDFLMLNIINKVQTFIRWASSYARLVKQICGHFWFWSKSWFCRHFVPRHFLLIQVWDQQRQIQSQRLSDLEWPTQKLSKRVTWSLGHLVTWSLEY